MKAQRAFAEKFELTTEILSLNIRYFVAILRFVEICAFLGTKQRISLMHCILNYICKFLITRKNDVFVTKIANTYQTKIFMPIFALADRLPTSANLPFQKVTIPQFYMRPDLFSV